MGRFLQTDPIGYYYSMNLYEYCLNNPVNWIDPWGLRLLEDDEIEPDLPWPGVPSPCPDQSLPPYMRDWTGPDMFDQTWFPIPDDTILLYDGLHPKPSWWPYPPKPPSDWGQQLFEEILGLGIGYSTGSPFTGTNPTGMGDGTISGNDYRRRMREAQQIRESRQLNNPDQDARYPHF
jgi:hypothetical protein